MCVLQRQVSLIVSYKGNDERVARQIPYGNLTAHQQNVLVLWSYGAGRSREGTNGYVVLGPSINEAHEEENFVKMIKNAKKGARVIAHVSFKMWCMSECYYCCTF